MRIIRILTMTLAAAVIAATACTSPEMMPEEKAKAAAGEDSPVTVTLDLNLANEINATPGTKAIDDPAAPASTEIRNLCVLQYSGTTEDSKLLGVHYFSKDITDTEDEHYLAADYSNITLSDSWGATHTLIILANTFAEIDPPGWGDREDRTLGDMLHACRAAESEASVFGHNGSGEGFPDDVTYYQRLNAIAVTQVSNGKTVHAIMRRSMSRINVEIINSGADNLQIQSVQLRNVSQKDYYLTDYSYIDTWDSWSVYATANLISTPFRDEYVGANPMRMDYRARTWAEGGPTALSGGSVKTNYTWYVPCNMRGTFSSTDYTPTPEMKGTLPNALGATYIYIIATYGADNDPVEYRFYLGRNLTDNFDLDPGKSYSYRFTFNGKGRPSTDDRVTAWSGEDFTVDANCYMVCPPPAGTVAAVYSFNVVHRINTFWGTSASEENDRYGFQRASQYTSNYIASGIGTTPPEQWKARILWSDYPYDRDAILTRNSGDGGGSYTDARQRVEITIPAGTEPGNLVIGVWTDDPDNILWSWHIWITDYRPDDARNLHPIENTYVYNVTGGEVHRYGGTLWASGKRYANAFIMDRNLGALRDWWSNVSRRGDGLYYQFGRKDPFTGYYGFYTYAYDDEAAVNYNGSSITINSTTHMGNVPGSYLNWVSPAGPGQGRKNVPWSINNPCRGIWENDRNWTQGDIFNPDPYDASIIWQDPKNSIRGDHEEGIPGNTQNKSIFDPCPPGWIMPVWNWNDGFTAANFVWGVESTYGRGRGNGRTYFPETGGYEVNKDNPDRQSIFFPATGRYQAGYNGGDGRGITLVNTNGYYWSSSPNGIGHGDQFNWASSGGISLHGTPWYCRTLGNQVRCVLE